MRVISKVPCGMPVISKVPRGMPVICRIYIDLANREINPLIVPPDTRLNSKGTFSNPIRFHEPVVVFSSTTLKFTSLHHIICRAREKTLILEGEGPCISPNHHEHDAFCNRYLDHTGLLRSVLRCSDCFEVRLVRLPEVVADYITREVVGLDPAIAIRQALASQIACAGVDASGLGLKDLFLHRHPQEGAFAIVGAEYPHHAVERVAFAPFCHCLCYVRVFGVFFFSGIGDYYLGEVWLFMW
jgi:hypothetical protein